MNSWKNPILLLSGIGISNLGSWIYLIALNIAILNLTGSATAVAGLYIIRPIAILITNTWSGSIIDRVNKRTLMINIDIFRGILIFLIPFIESLWFIYLLLLAINILGAFFGPSSSIYITKLVPQENRKKFNSIMNLTSSGAFLTGPAIAGILIMYVGTDLCIIINAITFFICAFFIYLLPNIDKNTNKIPEPIQLKTIIEDWQTVKDFARRTKYFIIVYLLFQGAMLIGFALDSQEVTYIKQNLKLTDRDYGLIVSITGVGAIAGAFVAAACSKKIQLKLYIGVGMLLTSIGYIFFYASFNFITATFSFAFLGFFMAFANTGYATFFQNNVPVEIMGRFGSLANMIEGIIQITFTLLLGFFAEWFSLQVCCLIFSLVGALFATILFATILIPSKMNYFKESSDVFTK
ncbi:MFS transporter [Bacillus thuringiensis]|uniref:MFS transporter n=1 Tax=Bacillus thuringiensis serovar toumanoffi TaxID=180862 RepID=A0ABD5HQM6_BACTU|nr:MFS transporter [Bacillus thuringiensis]MCR6783903.1 MFS transporter [Bacillus thuringiensis]MCR6861823.1 MFS transporter [Bacillus thuringiensis]MCR6868685.1 MFS transporter [Bacillus thuringiensis]MDW9207236.1 MFS transporter [Bacillus thuringiensis serovar toumanoffi]MED2623478.1 MFS transporter [Bacillus thuringiensis]